MVRGKGGIAEVEGETWSLYQACCVRGSCLLGPLPWTSPCQKKAFSSDLLLFLDLLLLLISLAMLERPAPITTGSYRSFSLPVFASVIALLPF